MKLLQDVCVWPGLETMCGSGEAISAADVVCSNGDEQYSYTAPYAAHMPGVTRAVSPHGPVCHVSSEPGAATQLLSHNYTEQSHTDNGQ